MKQVYVNRLLRLAALLDRVDPTRFDLSGWAAPECGTSACAIGFAGMDAQFQAEGFRLVVTKRRFFLVTAEATATGLADVRSSPLRKFVYAEPDCRGLRRWPAVQFFFGIGPNHAVHLFADEAYDGIATPDMVASRIRRFVAQSVKTRMEPEVAAAMRDADAVETLACSS